MFVNNKNGKCVYVINNHLSLYLSLYLLVVFDFSPLATVHTGIHPHTRHELSLVTVQIDGFREDGKKCLSPSRKE